MAGWVKPEACRVRWGPQGLASLDYALNDNDDDDDDDDDEPGAYCAQRRIL